MDFAIASGYYAAEAVKKAGAAGDFSAAGLASYEASLRDSFVLLRPRTAASESIDLGDRPLAAFEPCTSQRAVEERLEEHGLAPTLIIRLEDAATIHALVEGGVANALLPRLALLDSDVDLRPLPDLPCRTVVLVWQRDRTLPPEAERFIELAAQTAAALAEDT